MPMNNLQHDLLKPIIDLVEPYSYVGGNQNPNDPRLADFVFGKQVATPRVAIVGFPVDEGVRRNGGRPGASAAPDKIRPFLYRMTPDARNFDASAAVLSSTMDVGNICRTDSLEESQAALATVVEHLLAAEVFPIIIGGGHETSFGHFRGYRRHKKQPSIVNVDAHPDVRPSIDGKGHSGSPFRQAAESVPPMSDYVVVGLNPASVSARHVQFLDERNFRYLWIDELDSSTMSDLLSGQDGPVMVTFDMDVVSQFEAPGVSAPTASGLGARDALSVAFEIGRRSSVSSMDLVEVNPFVDESDQTARLGAAMIWNVLSGFAHR